LDDEVTAVTARAAAAAAALRPPAVPNSPPPAPAVPKEEGGVGRAWGWSLVGAGIILGGGAIALWAFNGSKVQCGVASGDTDPCRSERKTGTAAIVTGGAALAALAGGFVVLAIDRGPTRLALSVHPSGFSFGGTF